ncbi:MAG: hypothetical protein O3B34_00975, partial [Bacteroidetes bacterium]|nr:hypothetical protein [Bacteroidota bacterium]
MKSRLYILLVSLLFSTFASAQTVSAGLNQEICAGETVTLSGSGANSYTWTSSLSITVQNGVPFTPTSTGFYIVNGYDASSTLVGTDTVTVTVNPLPQAPAAATSYTYCQFASSTQLTATATSGHTLKWYASNGSTVLSVAPTPSTSLVGSTTYYVSQVNSTTGCESSKIAISIQVVSLPSSPITSNITYCKDASASSLSATASTGNTL